MTAVQDMRLSGVAKHYGSVIAVEGVDLEIPAGCYVVLLGPSGSGKTTLLSILGGFTTPSHGHVSLGDRDITALPASKRPTVTVFQDYALFPHMTVGDNVAFGLSVAGMKKPQQREKAEDALALVGLPGMAGRGIDELSGGQRQRVALARALALEPSVLLLDEPLGALDLSLRRQMQDELKALQRATGRSFVHVTHDQEEAMALADLIVIMKDGRIEDAGPPQRLYQAPRTRFSATFLGESAVFDGQVASRDGQMVVIETELGSVTLQADLNVNETVALAIRPEMLRLAPATPRDIGLGEARIDGITFQGSFARVSLRGPGGMAFMAKCAPDACPEIGSTVTLSADPERVVLLDAAST